MPAPRLTGLLTFISTLQNDFAFRIVLFAPVSRSSRTGVPSTFASTRMKEFTYRNGNVTTRGRAKFCSGRKKRRKNVSARNTLPGTRLLSERCIRPGRSAARLAPFSGNPVRSPLLRRLFNSRSHAHGGNRYRRALNIPTNSLYIVRMAASIRRMSSNSRCATVSLWALGHNVCCLGLSDSKLASSTSRVRANPD